MLTPVFCYALSVQLTYYHFQFLPKVCNIQQDIPAAKILDGIIFLGLVL